MQGTFGSGGEVVFNLRIDTSQVEAEVNSLLTNFRQLEQVALRYLLLARRIGLPEDVERAMDTIARFIVAVRQLELTIHAAQIALAGAGPIGWLALGASATFTALSFYNISGSQ